MNSTLLIILIVVLLAVLVCYAFVAQTVRQKQQQKDRLLIGLNSRARSFRHMLEGLPANFLSRDLKLLVQRSLVQVCEQLARLDTANRATHSQEARLIAEAMTQTQQQPEQPDKPIFIENPKHSQDIKLCLEDLYKFVFQLESKRQLTAAQAEAYRAAIKNLVLQVTVDSYSAQGRMAFEQEKFRLAKHYYEHALNLLLRHGPASIHKAKVAMLQSRISDADQLMRQQDSDTVEPLPMDTEQLTEQEWKQFGENEASWKKKQVYD